jgi:hypothetical protein
MVNSTSHSEGSRPTGIQAIRREAIATPGVIERKPRVRRGASPDFLNGKPSCFPTPFSRLNRMRGLPDAPSGCS